MEILKEIIIYSETWWGRLLIQGLFVFIISEFAIRNNFRTYLLLFTNQTLQQRKFYSDIVAVVFNFIAGTLTATIIHWNDGIVGIFKTSSWIIAGATVFHVAWIRYIDKKLDNKFNKK